ncbi:ATP-dependent RNA helicase DEAH12, chloroplastic-like isoform X2 [Stegodyphus dumicola]|nr:ATP-dependent RNA helicase DEAH12, chloroplastic-like isoform X2 [Stegodyphus dumicola]
MENKGQLSSCKNNSNQETVNKHSGTETSFAAQSADEQFTVSDTMQRTVCNLREVKDFMQSSKYLDLESYTNQRYHSIGTGLYLTDELEDLPPRFRDKVKLAFEKALASALALASDISKNIPPQMATNISKPPEFSSLFIDAMKSVEETGSVPSDIVSYCLNKLTSPLSRSNNTIERHNSNERNRCLSSSSSSSSHQNSSFHDNYHNYPIHSYEKQSNKFGKNRQSPDHKPIYDNISEKADSETNSMSDVSSNFSNDLNKGCKRVFKKNNSGNFQHFKDEQFSSIDSGTEIYQNRFQKATHDHNCSPSSNKVFRGASHKFVTLHEEYNHNDALKRERTKFDKKYSMKGHRNKRNSFNELTDKHLNLASKDISLDSVKCSTTSVQVSDEIFLKSAKNNVLRGDSEKDYTSKGSEKCSYRHAGDSKTITEPNNSAKDVTNSFTKPNNMFEIIPKKIGKNINDVSEYIGNICRIASENGSAVNEENIENDTSSKVLNEQQNYNKSNVLQTQCHFQSILAENDSEIQENVRKKDNLSNINESLKGKSVKFPHKSLKANKKHTASYNTPNSGHNFHYSGNQQCLKSRFRDSTKPQIRSSDCVTRVKDNISDSSSYKSDLTDCSDSSDLKFRKNFKECHFLNKKSKKSDFHRNAQNSASLNNFKSFNKEKPEKTAIQESSGNDKSLNSPKCSNNLVNEGLGAVLDVINKKQGECPLKSSKDKEKVNVSNPEFQNKNKRQTIRSEVAEIETSVFGRNENTSMKSKEISNPIPIESESNNARPYQKNEGKRKEQHKNIKQNFKNCMHGEEKQNNYSMVGSELHFTKSAVNEFDKIKNKCLEVGFFIKINVSENAADLKHWKYLLTNAFEHDRFTIEPCCQFTGTLILEFNSKKDALNARNILNDLKTRSKKIKVPHVVYVSTLLWHLKRPCDCEEKIISDCQKYVSTCSKKYIAEHEKKIKSFTEQLNKLKGPHKLISEHKLTLREKVNTLIEMKDVFKKFVDDTMSKLSKASNMLEIQKLKIHFSRECNSLQRCLPIYSRKTEILRLLRYYSVSVVVAETGSGKSTQLVEYFLQSNAAERGTIICTQPRKIAALSLTEFVSGQIGSAVGQVVGYDIGTEKKYCYKTKIIFMTDYSLLKMCLRNRHLKGISCVVIDEAHERTLYTDLLLGMIKNCVQMRPDFRVVITSATINPDVFKTYFNLPHEAIISVPGRMYPVQVVWMKNDVSVGWDHVEACVKKAHGIHTEKGPGDILVFLTSPSEIGEAISMFKELCSSDDKTATLLCLHGKCDIQEQVKVFQTSTDGSRKIIFATNSAETSLTIPGIKYVVDSGMAKEMVFLPEKKKNALVLSFINKSSAEQRKGRAGRTQPGICYRMYSEENYKVNMPARSLPELLRTNLQKALLKILEFGIQPECFEFIESPPKEAILTSLDSLEHLGAIKDNKLTNLGKQLAQLPIEPRFAKLIIRGIDMGIGYEAAIIAAIASETGKLFMRPIDNKIEADNKKREFCLEEGDLCTYLDIYKRWLAEPRDRRYQWCIENFINSKALNVAAKVLNDIVMNLRKELCINLLKRYNNLAFKSHYEAIIFECFSENLCIFSGHPQTGYLSPYLSEMFFLHPSSSLCYLGKDNPEFLVYTTLMETSRNYLMDVTPISEETVRKAYQKGIFKLQVDILKYLQMHQMILGPFGESVLVRHVLGKGGCKIMDIENQIEKCTRTKNFRVDVKVDKGLVVIYIEKRFHVKVSDLINEIIQEAHLNMMNEEDAIQIMGSTTYFCLGAGGIISDIIMPGEFKEVIIENCHKNKSEHFIDFLKKFGLVQSVKIVKNINNTVRISVTFFKAADAETALLGLRQQEATLSVRSTVCHPRNKDKSKPLFRVLVTWCRIPSSGTGWIEFYTQEDCIAASGKLTNASFYIGDNYIQFTPSRHNVKELYMKNLPPFVTEKDIRVKLLERLPGFLKVRDVTIKREKSAEVSKKDIDFIKQDLLKLFSHFTSPKNLLIDVKLPKAQDTQWNASVYFECIDDGERALRELAGKAKLGQHLLHMQQILKSHLNCKILVYEALEKNIAELAKDYKQRKICQEFSVIPNVKEGTMHITFGCKNISELGDLRRKLMKLLQGRVIEWFGNPNAFFIFTKYGQVLIDKVGNSTKTYIVLNNMRKSISIYGSVDECKNAERMIRDLVNNQSQSNTKVFDLNNSNIPSGFIKCLFNKYGLDLHGLIDDFNLKAAHLDVYRKKLMLEGQSIKLKKAEENLEKICAELYAKYTASEDNPEETCPICLDPISYDFQRLENCGHVFCKSCLLLQVKSKSIPLICVKQNCEKPLFLEDIKRILSVGGEDVKKQFYDAAVQYHVKSNMGKISYCPTPDCPTVFRVSKGENSEFLCPACENVICTHCQTIYHYGISCDMFQNSEKDEDYSLKVWIKENESARKHCPKCNMVIEKESGCNHMECVNCNSHMCWLCLKIFPTGPDVYDHLPYCPENQNPSLDDVM